MNIFKFATRERRTLCRDFATRRSESQPEAAGCFLSANCGSRGEFFLTEQQSSCAPLQFFVAGRCIHHRDTRNPLSTRRRSTGPSALCPSSKNVGATPILADGKSAWTQGGSASSHDSSSPIFSPFLPPLFCPPPTLLWRRVSRQIEGCRESLCKIQRAIWIFDSR